MANHNGVYYSNSSGLNLRTNTTTRINISTGGVIQFNSAYTFPTSDGSTDEVLLTNGSGALSFGTVPNAGLTNSSLTLGSTSVSLGGTASSIAGLTSITADTIYANSVLRISQNGDGLRMTNVGAFDNDGSNNFRIFSNNDLILSTNGSLGTAVTFDSSSKDATFQGQVIGSFSGSGANLNSIPNSSLDNSSLTVTAGSGLANGGSVSLGGSVTLNVGAGTGIVVNANDVALDYAGTDNFIDSATNLEGTGIALTDTIVYHDATDNNVKKGLVSDLPFSNSSGTVTSVAISGTDGIDVDSGSPITTSGTITLGLSNIPNSVLANDSVTIGSTSIDLGATSTTLAGLTSVTSTAFSGNLTGNADTATTLATARNFSITGDVTASNVSFNGSANVALNGTVTKIQGVSITSGEATQLANIGTTTISAAQWGYLGGQDQSVATGDDVTFNSISGPLTGDVTGNLDGNAGTATSLETARNFSITGDITASAISFDGTGNVQLNASIDSGVVDTAELATNAVTTVKITDGNVTNAKLANSSFTVNAPSGSDPVIPLGGTVNLTSSDGSVTISGNSTSDTIDLVVGSAVDSYVTGGTFTSGTLSLELSDGTSAQDITGFWTSIPNSALSNSSVTVTAGNGLTNGGSVSLGGSVTLNVAGGSGIVANANDVALDYSGTDNFILAAGAGSGDIQTSWHIAVSDASNNVDYYDVNALPFSNNQGTVTSVGITAGNLIDVTNSPITTNGNITVDVDLSELTTSTSNADGDFFVVVDSSNNQKKLTKANINNSGFNNDAGYITSAGNTNIYSTNGTLSASRTVTQNGNNLEFQTTGGANTKFRRTTQANRSITRVMMEADDFYENVLELDSSDPSTNLVSGYESGGARVFSVDGQGNLIATSKAFDIPHPNPEKKEQGMRLKHGNLEGPEHGVYIRGRQLNDKEIELPEYWRDLVDPDSITVQLTSVGSHQNLYVKKIEDNVVYIGNGNLFSNKIDCYYFIQAERKDIDKIEVEY